MNNHKEWFYSIITGLMVGLVVIGVYSIPKQSELTKGYSTSLDKVRPYVVSIYSQANSVANNVLLDDPLLSKYISSRQQTSLGSGILLGERGLVVTNAHVINRASSIIIETHDGQQAPAMHYWIDADNDIALIQTGIEITPNLPISSIENVKVGDLAFTIGNPFGVGQSVSMGIISATGRKRPNLTNLTDFIQTDAAINPGNSGGALVDSLGQVIGMNSAMLSSSGGAQGIGFAIPIQYVLTRSNYLQQQPITVKGFIGIDVIETPDAQADITIASVMPNGPAASAGLAVNDQVIAINGDTLSRRQEIIEYIQRQPTGAVVEFSLIRDNEPLSVLVVVQGQQP